MNQRIKTGESNVDGTLTFIDTRESPDKSKLVVMGNGYWCSLAGDDVFIIAENIADLFDKLEMIANGRRYEMMKHKSIPVYHCP